MDKNSGEWVVRVAQVVAYATMMSHTYHDMTSWAKKDAKPFMTWMMEAFDLKAAETGWGHEEKRVYKAKAEKLAR